MIALILCIDTGKYVFTFTLQHTCLSPISQKKKKTFSFCKITNKIKIIFTIQVLLVAEYYMSILLNKEMTKEQKKKTSTILT